MRWLFSLLLLLLFAVPVRAEEGYPPVDSEAVVAGRMFDSSREAVRFLHRLKALPWIRAGVVELEKALEIKLEGDFLDWMDGRVVLAVVRTGDKSPFYRFFGSESDDPRRDIQFNLQTLYNAVELYQLDKNELPPSVESLVPDYLAAIPSDPEGVTYRLEPGPEGTWTLSTTYQGEPGPTINSHNELTPDLESEEMPHLNLVVAFREHDAAQARRAMGKLLPRLTKLPGVSVEEAPDGWDVGTLFFSVAVRSSEHWLVFTDAAELAAPSLASLEGRGPSLTSNPRWQEVREHLPGEFRNWIFVDVTGIVAHWPGLKIEDPMLRQAVESIHAVAGTTTYTSDVVSSDFFVRIDPPPGHPLAELLEAPGPSELTLLRQAPWSTAYISVIDLGQSYDLLKRASGLSNESQRLFTEALQATDEALGMSFEQDILPHSTGEIAVSYEQLDLLYAALVRQWRRFTTPPPELSEEPEPEPEPAPGWVPEGPAPDDEEDMPSPAEIPEEEVNLAEMPYTVIIGLRPGPGRDEILARLKAKLGAKVRLEPHDGADILITPDDQVAYAVYGNYLMVSAGGSVRLMRNTLDAMTGKVAPISRLDSYQRFSENTRGRVLAAAHQKVDDFYSILKGVILLSGAEFRPEATALGRWRDAYSVLSIEPGGFRLRFSVFATEQVP